MEPVVIERGEKVSLGLVQKDLIQIVQRWINDRDINRNLRNPGMPYYPEEEESWYEALSKNKHTDRIFMIYMNDTYDPIGLVGLHHIDPVARHAEIGYLMAKEYWGQGFGTEAVSLIIRYGKDVVNLRKVYASVKDGNMGSSRVLEKNGLKQCGKFTEHDILPGTGFVDLLFFERFL